MSSQVERIETSEYDEQFAMPYAGARKVRGGNTVYLAGVTAAPMYHSHPHVAAEFDDIPLDPAAQARAAMENVGRILEASGGMFTDVVQATYYMVDMASNQDAVYPVIQAFYAGHRPATTTVEVTRLATDPRLILEVAAIAVVDD
ncbi:MAG: Rid family hydrolase [Nitriliruptoraceae bacterium]